MGSSLAQFALPGPCEESQNAPYMDWDLHYKRGTLRSWIGRTVYILPSSPVEGQKFNLMLTNFPGERKGKDSGFLPFGVHISVSRRKIKQVCRFTTTGIFQGSWGDTGFIFWTGGDGSRSTMLELWRENGVKKIFSDMSIHFTPEAKMKKKISKNFPWIWKHKHMLSPSAPHSITAPWGKWKSSGLSSLAKLEVRKFSSEIRFMSYSEWCGGSWPEPGILCGAHEDTISHTFIFGFPAAAYLIFFTN